MCTALSRLCGGGCALVGLRDCGGTPRGSLGLADIEVQAPLATTQSARSRWLRSAMFAVSVSGRSSRRGVCCRAVSVYD